MLFRSRIPRRDNWIGDLIGVRPESTRITHDKPADVSTITASVDSTTFLGHCIQVRAISPTGQTLVAEIPRADALTPFAQGDSVHLWWHSADEVRLTR